MKFVALLVLLALGLALWFKSSQQPTVHAAASISDLHQDADYLIVNGADLKTYVGDLLRKRIRFDGRVVQKSHLLNTCIFHVQGGYYIVVTWGGSQVPNDMTEQLEDGGIQDGTRLRVWGSIDLIYEGAKRYMLSQPSCHIKVDKWERVP